MLGSSLGGILGLGMSQEDWVRQRALATQMQNSAQGLYNSPYHAAPQLSPPKETLVKKPEIEEADLLLLTIEE